MPNQVFSQTLGDLFGGGGSAPALWTAANTSTELWLDADDASTITDSSGDVSVWADKKGNGRNATRGTVSQQPTTGVLTIGGLNALDFIDDNHYMNIPASIWTGGITHVYIVGSTAALRATQFFLSQDGVGSAAYPIMDQSASTSVFFDSATSAGLVDMRADGSTTNLAKIRSTYDAAIADGGTHMFKMIDVPQSNSITSISRPNATASWKGPIAEIVVVPDSISSDDADKMEGYLAWKWDGGVAGTLVGALPGGHPYKSAAPLA